MKMLAASHQLARGCTDEHIGEVAFATPWQGMKEDENRAKNERGRNAERSGAFRA